MKISNVPIESQDTCTHSIEIMSIPIEGQLRENTPKCGRGRQKKVPFTCSKKREGNFRRRFVEACDFIYNVHSLFEESELSTFYYYQIHIPFAEVLFSLFFFFLVVEKKSID